MQEAERVQAEIQRVLGEDPTIQGADRVLVTVERKSIWKGGGEFVHLKGSVRSDADKAKIERIAAAHGAGRSVVDEITVVH
jgi:hypothetical protein